MTTAELSTPTPTSAAPRREPFPRLWTAAEFPTVRSLFPGRAVELVGGQVVEWVAGEVVPQPVVFTRKEYYALGDANFFYEQRVQLIGGVIVQESHVNSPHAVSIRLTTKVLDRVFATGHDVRVQLPLDLGLLHEPHPDFAVVIGEDPRDYLPDHPKTAVLVVEVGDATVDDDTHDKASLYAAAGIPDYWVIDLVRRQVLVFRDSKPKASERFGHVYARLTAHDADATISPLAAPESRVKVADMLP